MMPQKSLVYMVLAVAVGYLLVSAVPQQIAMYTTPQQMLLTGGTEESLSTYGSSTITVSPENDSEAIADAAQAAEATEEAASQANKFEVRGSPFESSFIEQSRLPELLKWWMLDILVALTIYWVAKRRLV